MLDLFYASRKECFKLAFKILKKAGLELEEFLELSSSRLGGGVARGWVLGMFRHVEAWKLKGKPE